MTAQLDLYQQVILEHNKHPRNFGKLPAPSHMAEGFNPLCGDHLWVYLAVDGDTGTVREASFEGSGCAICKASASLMTTAVKGQPVAQVHALFNEFQSLLKGELDPEAKPHGLGKLKVFAGIWHYPARVKCAALAWHALSGALQSEAVVSTE